MKAMVLMNVPKIKGHSGVHSLGPKPRFLRYKGVLWFWCVFLVGKKSNSYKGGISKVYSSICLYT